MSETQPRFYKVMLMILPVGVVVGTIIFMFMYFYMEREGERQHAVIASYGMRVDDLDDMVEKFSDRIGQRDHRSEYGRHGMKQAASMIEGKLGPLNVGYPVKKGEGEAVDGQLWKSVWVDLRGTTDPDQVILAAVSYAGPGDDADGNAVSTMMMLASSMAREKPAKTIRFVFLPMDQSPELQNRWLLDRCIGNEETCVGIVGLKTMDAAPQAGGEDWEVVTSNSDDLRWWKYLSEAGTAPEQADVSVWISNAVFSSKSWTDRRFDRLQQTLKEAKKIEGWLRQAAK